jgi:histidinol-phosphate aminotransferase
MEGGFSFGWFFRESRISHPGKNHAFQRISEDFDLRLSDLRYDTRKNGGGMISRRLFAQRFSLAAASLPLLTEAALAQRALVIGEARADTIWLNANENPDGPGKAAIEAMTEVLPSTFRYHYSEFGDFYAAVARSEGLQASQVLVGAGSSEIIHAAIDVYTSPTRPLIASDPVFELPAALATALGHPVVRIPLTPQYGANVKQLAAEAEKAGGGLIYICNPNNPTSSITPGNNLDWLAANLPPNTFLLLDEAYIHFAEPSEIASGIPHVHQGRNVIVARTFSKIYGMAGLRVGFGCARPDIIRSMTPFRDMVISIVGARAAQAALAESATLIPQRRAKLAGIRRDLCAWLRENGLGYIEPHANFVMIDVKRDAPSIISGMMARGVAVGRPFPPLNQMLRVSLGTESDMIRFKQALQEVLKSN